VDNTALAFLVLIVGFLVVMLILFLLYLLLVLFSRLFYHQSVESPASIEIERGKPELTPSFLSPQLKAAITAAVYQYLSEPLQGSRIAITIHQDQLLSRSGWAAAGRKALLESRWELELLRRKKRYEKI
jgi:Na+-transporting methylmalonyl-CoA/oxaloacetate decarboxylase gamma subunit